MNLIYHIDFLTCTYIYFYFVFACLIFLNKYSEQNYYD